MKNLRVSGRQRRCNIFRIPKIHGAIDNSDRAPNKKSFFILPPDESGRSIKTNEQTNCNARCNVFCRFHFFSFSPPKLQNIFLKAKK
jgi:hypothetical protein